MHIAVVGEITQELNQDPEKIVGDVGNCNSDGEGKVLAGAPFLLVALALPERAK